MQSSLVTSFVIFMTSSIDYVVLMTLSRVEKPRNTYFERLKRNYNSPPAMLMASLNDVITNRNNITKLQAQNSVSSSALNNILV